MSDDFASDRNNPADFGAGLADTTLGQPATEPSEPSRLDLMLAPPEPPDPSRVSLMLQHPETRRAQLEASLRLARETDPDQAAQDQALADRLGVPPDVVARNRDIASQKDPDQAAYIAGIAADNPALAEWLLSQPHAQVAHDDLENLRKHADTGKSLISNPVGWIRDAATGVGQAWNAGAHQHQLALESVQVMDALIRGQSADEDLARLRGLAQEEIETAGYFVDEAVKMVRGSYGPAAVTGVRRGLQTGLGLATGAAVLGQAGPQAAIPEELITVPSAMATGFGIGARAGAIEEMFRLEGGLLFAELVSMKDENGEHIDPYVALVAAGAGGAVNAGLETLGLGIGAHQIMKGALRAPTIRSALLDLSKRYGLTVGGEVTTEIIQETTNIIAGEVAKLVDSGEWKTVTGSEVAGRLAETAIATTQAIVVLGAPGVGARFTTDMARARRAKREQEAIAALADQSAASKVRERAPAAYRDVLDRVLKDGPIETLYIDSDQFTRFFQGQQVDPQEIAEDLGIGEQYRQAQQAGGDLAIPTAKAAERLGGTRYFKDLAPDFKTTPDGLSGREAEQVEAQATEEIERLYTEERQRLETAHAEAVPRQRVFNDLKQQLVAAGRTAEVAEHEAEVTTRVFEYAARESGQQVDDVYARWKVRIQGPAQQAEQAAAVQGETFDQFAGLMARTAKLDRLETARQMRAEGQAPSDIWRATGWNLGADGQWRFEIQDHALRGTEAGEAWFRAPKDTPIALGDLIEHPALLAAYPDLADLKVVHSRRMPRGIVGSYAPPRGKQPETIWVHADATGSEFAKILLHEIQHAIQAREGHSDGTSPSVVRSVNADSDPYDLYERNAGEVEARNVESRLTLTPEQAADLTPEETEDFARAEQWVTFDEIRPDPRQFGAAAPRILIDGQEVPAGRIVTAFLLQLPDTAGPDTMGGWHEVATRLEAAVTGMYGADSVEDILSGAVFESSQDEYGRAISDALRWARQHIEIVTSDNPADAIPLEGRTLFQQAAAPAEPGDFLAYDAEIQAQSAEVQENVADLLRSLPELATIPDWALDALEEMSQSVATLDLTGGELRSWLERVLGPAWGAEVSDMVGDLLVDASLRPAAESSRARAVAKIIDVARAQAADQDWMTMWSVYSKQESGELRPDIYNFYKYAGNEFELLSDKNDFLLSVTEKEAFAGSELQQHDVPADLWPLLQWGKAADIAALRLDRTLRYGLTVPEAAAVSHYTSGGGAYAAPLLNQMLREKSLDDVGRAYVDILNRALRKLPTYDGRAERTLNVDQGYVEELSEIGAVVDFAGFSSFSKDSRVFDGNVTLTAENSGVPYLDDVTLYDVSSVSLYSHENEVLAPPHARFRILSFTDAGVNERRVQIERVAPDAVGADGTVTYMQAPDEQLQRPDLRFQQARDDIQSVLEAASRKGHAPEKAIIGRASPWLVEQAAAHGLDLAGYRHAIDGSGVRHVRKKHSDPQAEAKRGQIAVTDQDFARVPEVLAAPDHLVFGLQNDLGQPVIGYIKTMEDGTTLYLEAVRTGRKELALQSMRRYPAAKDAKNIASSIPSNAQNDGGDTPKIIDVPPGASAIDPTLPQRRPSGPRGDITFSPGGTLIRLFEQADLSTILHESGHLWLEVIRDLASRPEASAKLQQDWATIRDYLGITDDQVGLTREQHEKWARSVEAYFLEGKAPSIELRSLFRRFSAWLVQIYKTVKNLDVELTDDIRDVFDRLLATEEAIADAQAQQAQAPLFADQEAAGFASQAEWDRYLKLAEQAHDEAHAELLREAMAERRAQLTAAWRQEKSKIRTEVEAELNKDRRYVAAALLRRGRQPDGSDLELLMAPYTEMKIDRDIVKADWPDAVQGLGTMLGRGEFAVHPDMAAEILGFSSGDELIQALDGLEPYDRARARMVNARMKERHQELLDLRKPEQVAEAALDAVHSDSRGAFLAAELRALSKRSGEAATPVQVARQTAQDAIARRKLSEIKPDAFARAEAKAGRAAERAVAAGDMREAARQKRRQLINHYLYREAKKAREQAKKNLDYLKRFNTASTRKRIEEDYLAQIDAVLEHVELRYVAQKKLKSRKSLLEWIQKQEENGIDVAITPEMARAIDAARQRHWSDMQPDELQGLRDTVQNIAHLARLKNKLLAAKREREFEAAKSELIGAINANAARFLTESRNLSPTAGEKLAKSAGKWNADHTKPEFLFERLDGYQPGTVQELLFQPFVEAEGRELTMFQHFSERVRDIFSAYSRSERRRWYTKRLHIPELGMNLTKAGLISLALNWGNEGNRQAIIDARWTGDGIKWSESAVQQVLMSRLDKRDWDTVQAIWDLIDELWPEIAQLQKDLTGHSPAKVEAVPVVTPHGTYRGGYYPLKYDPARSYRAQQREEKQEIRELFGPTSTKPATRKGHTIERTSSGGQAVLLDLSVLSEHLQNVIHDVTHRRAILDIDKLTQDRQVREAIIAVAGKEQYDIIRPWLQDISRGVQKPTIGLEKLLQRVRLGTSIFYMGWKVTTAMVQPLGYTTTFAHLGTRYSLKGVKEFYGNPAKMIARSNFVMDRSIEMRTRQKTYDRELNELIRKDGGTLHDVQKSAFYFTGLMDMGVAIPTWLGAYEQGMDLFKGDETKAIAHADSVVRMTQSRGSIKDLARIQRGPELQRLWTMFYSYFSVLYNQFARATGRTRSLKDVPQLIATMGMLVFVPVVLETLMRGDEPDDDESELWWWATKLALYPFNSMVLARDVIGSIESGFDFQLSPATRFFEEFVRVARDFEDLDPARRTLEAATTVGSIWYGLPGRQVWITGEYFYDWLTGEEQPESLPEALSGLAFGAPRD